MTKSGTTELTTVVGSAAELMPGLESQWASLVKTSDVSSPFVSWGWYNAWLTAFCPSGDAQLIAVFDGDRLVGALPLWLNNSTMTSWVNTHSFRWSLLCERGNDRAARALASRLVQVENWDSCHLNYAVSDKNSRKKAPIQVAMAAAVPTSPCGRYSNLSVIGIRRSNPMPAGTRPFSSPCRTI